MVRVELPYFLAGLVSIHDRHVEVENHKIDIAHLFVLVDIFVCLQAVLSLIQDLDPSQLQVRSRDLELENLIVSYQAVEICLML